MSSKTMVAAVLVLGLGYAFVTGQTASAQEKKGKAAPVVPPREGKSETIKLFNGKNLDGWDGHEHLWSVKDGVIVAKNTDPIKVST